MPDITISLTTTEKRSLEYATVDVQDWVDNAATNRARIAKEEIISKLVTHCNENSIALAVGDSDQVAQAYTLGVIDTAADRQAQLDSDLANQ